MADVPVSIVIRTLNAAATLRPVLEALRRNPDDQLILVDSGSTDGTVDLARSHGAEVVLLPEAEFTYGRSLNRGFAAARHDWVLALSSHTVPMDPGFLDLYRSAVGRFPDRVTAAVGPIVNAEYDSPLPGGISYFEAGDFRHGFGFAAGNPNSLYRRSAWLRRPFDEALGGGEDLQWYCDALRDGEVLAVVHRARVRYISRRPMSAFYRKGRVDYRAMARLIEPHQPGLGGIVIRVAKLLLYAGLGRIDWNGAKGSIAHCLGNFVEARALRRAAR